MIRRHPRTRAVVFAAATLALLATAACSGDDADQVSSAGTEAPGDVAPDGDASQSGGQSGGGQSGGGQSGGGQSGGGQSGGGGGTGAPVINTFSTPDSIDCHNADFQTFTASWSTTGAVRTTISIDGPGVYETYGPSGEASLPFNCSSPHTFLLTAYAESGATATKSVTLQPRNAQGQSGGGQSGGGQSGGGETGGTAP